jgi:murein DD-endopeptidase MepM/ murein hydrolase activator NlpD
MSPYSYWQAIKINHWIRMAQHRYRYNPTTFQYEPIVPSATLFAKRFLLYLLLGFLIALPASYWYIEKFNSLQEQHLIQVNEQLLRKWHKLTLEISKAYSELDNLAKKDDHYYRTLLDLTPLDNSIREAGVGGTDRALSGERTNALIKENYDRLEKLKKQVNVARQSFEQLKERTDLKNTLMASTPAIQPIDKKQLRTLHLTFGTRLHPIFNVMMDHKGLDITAAFGTPVYATADGRISMAYFSQSYGNVVYIDHGFNYETRYAHLLKFKVKPGNYVKRGEIIGYVGNSGVSTAPHLHYEVYYNEIPVNPIYFFQRDLKQKEFQKIIQSQSLSNP